MIDGTDVTLQDVCATAGRPPAELTRRDIARTLLTVPATQALASLPHLRRELIAAGIPLSAMFWERTEALLSAIAHGDATVGEVRTWLEATGTEPTLFLGGGFLWPEEGERGPVATEMHARLVAHLEQLLAAGSIDPDALLAGDHGALAAHEREQLAWLRTPLEDGREPLWAVSDEEDEELLAAWDDAHADASRILAELLDELEARRCPDAELAEACTRLRAELAGPGGRSHDLLVAVAGPHADTPSADDRELWLGLATGVVTGGDVIPGRDDDLVDDTRVAWLSLEHPDWIGAVVTLAQLGPGAAADADALARYAATFDFEEERLDDAALDPDEVLALRIAFHPIARLWYLLGAIDEDERLTTLGWWGLPEALQAAWHRDDEHR